MKEFKLYYEQHKPELIEELFSLLRIPSISAVKDNHKDIVACAELWCKLLTNAGVDKAEVLPSKGNPVVYAERIVDKKLPTVLVYGHYDVMPAEPLELWETNPFEPVIKEGAIWGRGADDDKGQSFMHYIVFKYLNSTGKLNCNVKFLLEGEEEIGSPSLTDFCNKHKAKLAADIILVSDTSMLSADMPSITTGLRGLAYWQIEVTGPNRDLHSGIFGGAVANPINELCKLIAKLQDADGKITIPGFYDDVEELSAEEKKLVDKIPFNETEYKQALDVEQLYGEKGYNTIERTGNRPSLDVCGIWGGYTGEGAKTVLPSKAYAKLSTRLVPNQRYHKMSEAVINHINSIAPAHVSVQVKPLHGAESYVCPITLPAYKATEKAYEMVFGVRPLPVRRGGSIGVIAIFEEVLGIKSILMGFGLESDAIHSPNENYQIEMFEKGMQTIFEFYQIYGK